MSNSQNTMITPGLAQLLDRVDSRFTLVTLASQRARQLNSYFNTLEGAVGNLVPPQIVTASSKPLSMAFEEIDVGKITWERFDPAERELLEEQARLAAQADAAAVLQAAPDYSA